MTETMEGVVLEATFWGAELRRSGCCPTGWTPALRARDGSGGADILADVWSTSTGPFAD